MLQLAELGEQQKRDHFARLLKLPQLIDETLSSWVELTEGLSDKQVFQELLRMMGLPETVEAQLMRAMIEATKQHRLRREREEVGLGDWADRGPEPLHLRAALRRPQLPPRALAAEGVSEFVNTAGDGNEFAVFLASLLHAIGAHTRLNLGCSKNATLPTPPPKEAKPWVLAAHEEAQRQSPRGGERAKICQWFAEVRLGRRPSKMAAWTRSWLPGSRWLGKVYHYRVDRNGYAWLNLDWAEAQRVQRLGVPYKAFDTMQTFYPGSNRWEAEGDETDSNGEPRLKRSPMQQLNIGLR